MSSVLEVTGVSKAYGGVQALSGCHIEVEEGAIHGLIGPNGSGKTTLFNVITGYERIQEGEVRFNGDQITNARPDRVFGLGVGRTFQLTRIFARLTVLENMLVATQRKEGWVRSLLRIAGSAAERRRAMELLEFVGIARLAHEPAGNLSYGQRKLLELASLLVADPDVLLLDEPAGGVNPTLITHLADRIRELNKAGKTFVVVEHNMEFVMDLCHRVTVLSQGTPLVSGAPDEVRSNPAVLDAYLGGEDDEATQRELADEIAHRHHAAHPVQHAARTPTGPKAMLSIDGVTAGYGGGDILKRVTFDVPEGGITCIVGPNGAGKSTLLSTISCLMLDPALIILDEPSMGLDPQIRQIVFEMIATMHSRGKTILLVEQNARAGLKLSSDGVVLENGMVRLTGSGREVLEHPEIGALYLGGAVSDDKQP